MAEQLIRSWEKTALFGHVTNETLCQSDPMDAIRLEFLSSLLSGLLQLLLFYAAGMMLIYV